MFLNTGKFQKKDKKAFLFIARPTTPRYILSTLSHTLIQLLNLISNSLKNASSVLNIRTTVPANVPAIAALSERVYQASNMHDYAKSAITEQNNNFPQGKIVATINNNIAEYCATFVISANIAQKPHT